MINVLDRQEHFTAFVNEQKWNKRIIQKDIFSPQRGLNNVSTHFVGGTDRRTSPSISGTGSTVQVLD
jgi:hypothetical protein